jgi:hypothetical protein
MTIISIASATALPEGEPGFSANPAPVLDERYFVGPRCETLHQQRWMRQWGRRPSLHFPEEADL